MKRCVLLCGFALTLAACSDRDDGRHQPAKPPPSPTNRIEIPPTVRSNLGMTFADVQRRTVEQTVRIPGAFELLPQARREYRLSLPGTVHLEVAQYQPVQPGDLLYRVRSPKWPELQHEIIEGEQGIAMAQAQIAVATASVEEAAAKAGVLRGRLEALEAAGVRNAELAAKLETLLAAMPRLRAELGAAETALANARRGREHALHRASSATGISEERLASTVSGHPAYRDIDLIDVTATEPGVVETLAVSDGSYAEAPAMVLSTVQPERVRLRGTAMQADLPRIGSSPSGSITSSSTSNTDEFVEADVVFGLEADPAHRTISVLATPTACQPWMRPGVAAFLELTGEGGGAPALAIPMAAVVKDGTAHVFFRRDPADPNQAIRVPADLGENDGRWVVIRSGLSLGDEVVVDGAYELNLASQASGVRQRGGHFHADGTYHAEDH